MGNKKRKSIPKIDFSKVKAEIKPYPIPGIPVLFPLTLDGRCVAYAVLSVDENDHAILWHMQTDPPVKKNGLATMLIKAAQKQFKSISTEITGNSERLLKRLGFGWIDEKLVWDKKNRFQYVCRDCKTERDGLLDHDHYDWVCPGCKGMNTSVKEMV